jgi:hypothetical protein
MERNQNQKINQSSAWRGAWNRPMHIDEKSLDPLTVARMTDHNVRGGDREGDLNQSAGNQKDEIEAATIVVETVVFEGHEP